MSDSVRPHRWQPTRLPRPWDSPGKNTGVGCHFLLQCMKVKNECEVTESCPTLCDPMDCGPPGSSVHGIFQARVPLPSPINHIILLNSLGSCDNEIVYMFVFSTMTILEQIFKKLIPFSIYMNCLSHSSFYLLMYLRVEAYYIFVFLFYFFL